MTHILITGASGFVGTHVITSVRQRGATSRAAVRDVPKSASADTTVIVGEIDGSTDWGSALDGIDAVIHCAARAHVLRERAAAPLAAFRHINVEGAMQLAETMVKHGVKRLVFVSSLGVNGQSGHFDQASPVRPALPYAISKWEAEQCLFEIAARAGLALVVVRPPLVYGDGAPGNIARLRGLIARGLPLPLASVHNARTLIGVDNLADFLVTCAVHPAAPSQTFLIGDHETVSTADILRGLAADMNKTARLFPFPLGVMRVGARLIGKAGIVSQLTDSLTVDSSFARARLGWSQPFPSPFARIIRS